MHVRLQENVYTPRRERERFHLIRARTPLPLVGLKLLQFVFSTYLISEVYYAECLLITTIKETRTEQN